MEIPKLVVLIMLGLALAVAVAARPASFQQDFVVVWGHDHVKQAVTERGSAVQLVLDQSSGSGFASRTAYLFGHVSMKIKLVPGDSAGTVVAFYMNSETGGTRDELDFEFLGNRTGQPYTAQTNIYVAGKGDREQRVNLWFDPSKDFHTYSILWNHFLVIFAVDEVPIRVHRNEPSRGVPYPNTQYMKIYSTLWEADDWATRGGLEKIDWSKAPFYAYYTDFNIDGCAVAPGGSACAGNLQSNPWEAMPLRSLTPMQRRLLRWVRLNHLIYDYCTDRSRYPVPPPECLA